MSLPIVVLDPGHGGRDPGAVNELVGITEAEMTLDVCVRAQALLSDCCEVVLTRGKDCFVSLRARPALANQLKAAAFVSYHFNAASSSRTALSFEGFTTPGQNNSDRLCQAILDHHGRLLPEQSLRADTSDKDDDKEANFAVIWGTRCPSCLIEGEFIHTTHGAELIKKDNKRQMMALAVALGVKKFLGLGDSSDQGRQDFDFLASIRVIEKELEAIKKNL
jgi:N-acetylmuramoyl-L-alanine amidase|tara:strand:+ start:22 stop:684 length:663 start_codon:yes stop_codon:yes gene_type:complete